MLLAGLLLLYEAVAEIEEVSEGLFCDVGMMTIVGVVTTALIAMQTPLTTLSPGLQYAHLPSCVIPI